MMYSVSIWFWTGSMNEYKNEVIENLNKEQAESLFASIQADGIVEEVDLKCRDDLLMSKFHDLGGVVTYD